MTAANCPICGKPSVAAHQPFCSVRCADVDLHRWLTGGYTVPAAEDSDDRDDPANEADED